MNHEQLLREWEVELNVLHRYSDRAWKELRAQMVEKHGDKVDAFVSGVQDGDGIQKIVEKNH